MFQKFVFSCKFLVTLCTGVGPLARVRAQMLIQLLLRGKSLAANAARMRQLCQAVLPRQVNVEVTLAGQQFAALVAPPLRVVRGHVVIKVGPIEEGQAAHITGKSVTKADL